MEIVMNILKIAASIMIVFLSRQKEADAASETLKSYIDYTYIKIILFVFVLCA